MALAGVVVLPGSAKALSAGVAFSADSLPSWQADGVAFAVAGSGSKVVVGGSFTSVRPPAGGTGSPLPSPGLVVLNADTGAPDACQLPAAMAGGTPTIYALTASPDGRTVYVGGSFSAIGGVAADRVAAIDVVSCSVKPMRVGPVSAAVYGLAATADTLYLAGSFSSVAGQPRAGFAAVDTTSGALRPFVANADKPGRALAVSPDGTRLAIGGDFFAVNGQYSHSIAVVDAKSGAVVRTYPAGFISDLSVTKAIASDGTNFYVGNEGRGSGVFDGRLAVDWTTLDEKWRDTCLGATQALLPYQGILYSANHVHDCSSIGYFPDGTRKYFVAQSTSDRSFRGWTPNANDGIGEGIGPRGLAIATGASAAKYMYAVGEFTQINGTAQQSITRFGTNDTGAPAAPFIQAEALVSNAVQVRLWTVVDQDDDTLTYSIYRNGSSTPIWTGKATSWWWSRPQITFTDTTVTPGQVYSYRARVTDGKSVSALSGGASATPVTKPVDYPGQVVADSPQLYWRFGEPSGTWTWNKGNDSTSAPNGLLNRGVLLGQPGAIASDTSAQFDGVDDFAWNDQLRPAPSVFSIETWIKTTTTRGGKVVGFTNGRPRTDTGAMGASATNYDRHIYMDNTGRLNFGTYNGSSAAVVRSAKSYNDGTWHHVVGSQDATGMVLYVDGVRLGRNARSSANSYSGVWKVGGDKLDGWPNRPTSQHFAGQIDDTAVYEGKTLSSTSVGKHYQLAGRTLPTNSAPADAYGAAVYGSDPELYWPLNELSGDALDKSRYGQRPGTVGATAARRVTSPVSDGFGIASDGTRTGTVATGLPEASPASWSAEVWFKTTSATGGKLLGFENLATGDGTAYDKHLYMTNAGAVVAGVSPSGRTTISSAAGLNNGQWHHVVATQDASGLKLYVDGAQVATSPVTTNQSYEGYWRLGGGNLLNWPSRPTTDYFSGALDGAAVYDHALTAGEVTQHFTPPAADGAAPTTPKGVTATLTAGKIAVSWEGSTDNVGVTGYDIFRGSSASFVADAASRVGTTDQLSFVDATASSTSEYFYVVKARDAAGNVSGASVAAHYAPAADTSAPSAPGQPVATVSAASVGLTWPASTDDVGVVDYQVHRGATVGFSVSASTLVGTASQPSYTDPGRTAGDWYYRVVARDAAGNVSAASPSVKATIADTSAPSVPGSPSAVVTDATVTVSWTASQDDVGVSGYRVYRGTQESFAVGSASEIGRTAQLSFVDAARPAGTWFYRVTAVDAAGNVSGSSAPVSAQVQPSTAEQVTVTLPAVADTMVAENSKTTLYGTGNQISSRAPGAGTELQAYLRFDLSALPADAVVTEARLRVTTSNDASATTTGPHSVRLLRGTWAESTTTWNSRPTDLGATLGELAAASQLNTAYTVPLDPAGVTRSADGTVSLALLGLTSDNLRLNSREATSTTARPTLTVSYTR